MANFKVGDRVKVFNNKGILVGEGTIVNINELREPSAKYAIDANFLNEDLIFVGEKNLRKIREEI